MKSNNRSRTKSALLNLISNTSYQLVNTLVNLIIPPLIIGRFGSTINGLISTIKQVISYVQLIGAGIAESTVVSLYKPIANGDEKKISAIYNASSKAFWQAGVMFSIISVLIAIFYPLFTNGDLDKLFVGCMVLVLCVAGASEFFVIGKCRTLLTANQKIYVVNIVQIVGACGTLLATMLMVYLEFDILIVQATASLAYVLRIVLLYLYVKRNYQFLDPKVKPDNTATSRRKAATVHQLAGLITFGSQTIVISKVAGFAEASVYSVYALVFTGLNTLLSTISSALLASFGDIIANESRSKLIYSYNLFEWIYFILVFLLYSVAYVMILPFIEIYTNGIMDINYIRPMSASLFCIMGILNCLRTPGGTLINAIGHYQETKSRALIEMTICFVGECTLVSFLGMNGVILGTIFAFLYRCIDVIIYSNNKILKRSCKFSFLRIIINLIAFVIIIWGASLLSIECGNYINWAFKATLITILGFLVNLIINMIFYGDECREVLFRLKQMIRR